MRGEEKREEKNKLLGGFGENGWVGGLFPGVMRELDERAEGGTDERAEEEDREQLGFVRPVAIRPIANEGREGRQIFPVKRWISCK